MIGKFIALAFTAILLCGCMLQSRLPLYDDAASELALGETGGKTRAANLKNGQWVVDDETVKVTVVGRHYEISANAATIAVRFVKLDGPWYVIQAMEAGKPAIFALAEIKNGIADLRVPGCAALSKNPELAKWIDYAGEDCFVKSDADKTEFFLTLAKNAGQPTSRIEIVP